MKKITIGFTVVLVGVLVKFSKRYVLYYARSANQLIPPNHIRSLVGLRGLVKYSESQFSPSGSC